ncbi:hypothetical protein [Dysgonomonas massiliensis]|uniref:hypothetical protein n=1 Tax=Dysgonomonas massiliensis TaxID=2040292 RepID=UPI000C7769B0|nr:hypothetical protein [Dysgonomonas massiliensis]
MQKINKCNFFEKYIVHLIINSIVILLIAQLLPMNYESNDDTAMLLFSSGVYSGTPDAHLVFINYIYGFLVSSLYRIYSGIEWYTVLFVVIHVVSFSIITWRLAVSKYNNVFKIIFLSLFCLIEVYCISALQFTTTAAVCALGSLLLYVSGNKTCTQILAILLFLLASLIRFEAAFLIFIIYSPLIGYHILQSDSSRKKIIVFLVLLVSLPVLAKQIDGCIYDSDESWKKYKEYNLYRGMINDNLTVLDEDQLPANITESDYRLLGNFFPDTDVFNVEVLKEISEKNKGTTSHDKFYRVVFNLLIYQYHVCIIIFISFLLFILLPARGRIILFCSLLLLTMSFIYMSIIGTLKPRVFVSTILALCWVLFALSGMVKVERKTIVSIFIISLLALFISLSVDISKWYNGLKGLNRAFIPAQETLREYVKSRPQEEIIVPYQSALRFEIYSPWEISKEAQQYKFRCLGWLSTIPLNDGEVDSFLDIIDQKTILIGKNNYRLFMKNIKKSISHHYGIEIQDNIIFENELYYLLKLTKKNDANDTI